MKRIFLFALTACVLASCSKSDDSNPQPASIIGTWKIIAVTSDKDVFSQMTGSMTKDIWAETQSCVKDNSFTFANGNVLTQDEGATKCSGTAPQIQTGTYSYQGTTLQMNDQVFTVLQLDNSTLKINRSTKYYFINTSQRYDSTDIVLTITEQRQ